MRPLNERIRDLPWTSLAQLPTPVHRLRGYPGRKASIWAKRDDLTSPDYGGNKIRKLEYLLGQALAEKRKAVLTFGAVGSNHVLATARSCATVGMQCIAILSRQAATPFLPGNLAAMIRSGAILRSCPRFSEIAGVARKEAEDFAEKHGSRPMLVPPGGSNVTGALGYVNAAFELDRQIEQGQVPEPDAIYLALGTMGSVVGLGLGLAATRRRSRIIAVKVVHDVVADASSFTELWAATNRWLCRRIDGFPEIGPEKRRVEVRDQYFGEGYAIPTREGQQAIDIAARSGLRLEPTYTGKTMAALVDDATRSRRDQVLLFWNTANSRPLAPASGVDTTGLDPELAAYLANP